MSIEMARKLKDARAKARSCLDGLYLRNDDVIQNQKLTNVVGKRAGEEIAQELRNMAQVGIALVADVAESTQGIDADAIERLEMLFAVLEGFADDIDGRDPVALAAAIAKLQGGS